MSIDTDNYRECGYFYVSVVKFKRTGWTLPNKMFAGKISKIQLKRNTQILCFWLFKYHLYRVDIFVMTFIKPKYSYTFKYKRDEKKKNLIIMLRNLDNLDIMQCFKVTVLLYLLQRCIWWLPP